jgi:quinol-cytochrome oxidoreductase complex cytochrome b subunit
MSRPSRSKRPARVLAWIARTIDASVLRVPRFFGFLYGRIDDGLALTVMWQRAMKRRLPGHSGWKHALGGVTWVLLMILIATGVLLSFYYRPSVDEAYGSIRYIDSDVSFGWLVRHVHFWSANLVVVLAVLHLFRVVISAAYKRPRETNWLVGLLLLVTILGFGMTGYLLPWDQWAYWATSQRLESISRFPLLGGAVVDILRGDESVGGATLSRFFALHVIVLPWLVFGLLGLHFQLVRKQGIAGDTGPDAPLGPPFFPHHALRQLMALVLTLGVVLSLALLYPPALSGPANPAAPPEQIRILWFPAAVAQALSHYLSAGGLVVTVVAFVLLAALPVLDRSPKPRGRHRPIALIAAAALAILLAVLWWEGRSPGEPAPGAPEEPVEEVGAGVSEDLSLAAVGTERSVNPPSGGGSRDDGSEGRRP